jgi:hypothetical protein
MFDFKLIGSILAANRTILIGCALPFEGNQRVRQQWQGGGFVV